MKSTRHASPIGALLAATLLSCGAPGRGPTASSELEDPEAARVTIAEASPLTSLVLTGRVVDAVTGAAVAGARIQVPDRDDTASESDPDGRFVVNVAASLSPLLVEAPGYFPRDTHLRVGRTGSLEVDLLPDDGRFDLDFFDHVFRNLGEDGTHPWTSEPTFEILSRAFDCMELDAQGFCELYQATADEVPLQFVNTARDVIATDAAQYTGGVVSGARVELVEVAPGTSFRRSEAWVRGTVRVVLLQLPTDYSWATYWYYRGPGDMYSGLISINRRHKALRGVYSHELAHTLGYAHPRGGDEVPLASIMRYGHGSAPEANDVLHGRLLYRRPPGSRSPDRDPDDFVLNGVRTLDAPPGELSEVTAR